MRLIIKGAFWLGPVRVHRHPAARRRRRLHQLRRRRGLRHRTRRRPGLPGARADGVRAGAGHAHQRRRGRLRRGRAAAVPPRDRHRRAAARAGASGAAHPLARLPRRDPLARGRDGLAGVDGHGRLRRRPARRGSVGAAQTPAHPVRAVAGHARGARHGARRHGRDPHRGGRPLRGDARHAGSLGRVPGRVRRAVPPLPALQAAATVEPAVGGRREPARARQRPHRGREAQGSHGVHGGAGPVRLDRLRPHALRHDAAPDLHLLRRRRRASPARSRSRSRRSATGRARWSRR